MSPIILQIDENYLIGNYTGWNRYMAPYKSQW